MYAVMDYFNLEKSKKALKKDCEKKNMNIDFDRTKNKNGKNKTKKEILEDLFNNNILT